MSSQSFRKSQFVADENSQPSSIECQSSNKSSSSNPEPDVVLIDNDNPNVTNDTARAIVGGRKRNDVWNHFDKNKIGDVVKSICKYCKKQMKGDAGSGTSHL